MDRTLFNDPNLIFKEEQRFRQLWIWGLVIGLDVLFIVIWGYGIVCQLIFNKPWGNNPMSDSMLIIISLLVLVFMMTLTLLMYYARLITVVRYDGLFIRFIPFHLSFHSISLEEVTHCEVREYKPIREYGGWGIRYGKAGKAYNVSGNKGVLFVFANGKKLLIGSQKPEELYNAIKCVAKHIE